MQFKHFIGFDVSKATLDCALVENGKTIFHQQIKNQLKAIKTFLELLQKDYDCHLNQTLFTMEFTGIYTYHLRTVLAEMKANIWLVAPLHISRKGGLQRGKNDKIDAIRIAQFAYRNKDEYRPYIPLRPVLQQLKHLFSFRRQLVKCKKQINTHTQDLTFMQSSVAKQIELLVQKPVNQIDVQIKVVEQSMMNLIQSDKVLSRLYLIINSVVGFGLVLSVKTLLITNEFKTIKDPRKFACMAGVAPFEYSSGSSIRKQTRVSAMADPELKKLLHLAALIAIRVSEELKKYYDRKKQEGKHSMKVINAIRNKLIHRVFACVNQDRIYIKHEYERAD